MPSLLRYLSPQCQTSRLYLGQVDLVLMRKDLTHCFTAGRKVTLQVGEHE